MLAPAAAVARRTGLSHDNELLPFCKNLLVAAETCCGWTASEHHLEHGSVLLAPRLRRFWEGHPQHVQQVADEPHGRRTCITECSMLVIVCWPVRLIIMRDAETDARQQHNTTQHGHAFALTLCMELAGNMTVFITKTPDIQRAHEARQRVRDSILDLGRGCRGGAADAHQGSCDSAIVVSAGSHR